ncbi:MAG TPA: hypothetical protein VLT58_07375 [Polyangia bacterium]|nr:hypothetical protein [Polyangia bacterium]
MTRLQATAHVRGHRGDIDLAGLLLVASPIALLLAGWWWGVR